MKIRLGILISLLCLPAAFAQTRPPRKPAAASTAADRLGMACPQILAMTSTEWVAKFEQQKGSGPDSVKRATAAYGVCYDLRTKELAASLARRRKGPLKAARTDFDGLQTAVEHFTTTALADLEKPADPAKIAYITLYQKQFRYEFYHAYETSDPPLTADENDRFGKAKNRFGELLGLQPEDKAHQVHAAFGEIVGIHHASQRMKLDLYCYAIFILEPPTEKPFGPPPF